MQAPTRNFTTISPTARALLLLKSITDIPFAREAAALVATPAEQEQIALRLNDPAFLKRALHFENRYWTVEQLYRRRPTANVLEISAGYSFRSLDHVLLAPVHYVDTDLPEVVQSKSALVARLLEEQGMAIRGPVHLQPLNALDEEAFLQAIDLLPEGPVTILNEGLLMYLDPVEKQRLCNIIYKVLQRRGGCWITGDVYVRHDPATDQVPMPGDAETQRLADFFAYHKIEENKFDSLPEAEAFFNHCGFVVTDRMALARNNLSLL
ncbi:MAG TPA: hypothetical protein VGC22_02155, partial [Chitinophaga sp.]